MVKGTLSRTDLEPPSLLEVGSRNSLHLFQVKSNFTSYFNASVSTYRWAGACIGKIDKFMAFQMSGLNVKTDPGPEFSDSKDIYQNSIASTHSFLL